MNSIDVILLLISYFYRTTWSQWLLMHPIHRLFVLWGNLVMQSKTLWCKPIFHVPHNYWSNMKDQWRSFSAYCLPWLNLWRSTILILAIGKPSILIELALGEVGFQGFDKIGFEKLPSREILGPQIGMRLPPSLESQPLYRGMRGSLYLFWREESIALEGSEWELTDGRRSRLRRELRSSLPGVRVWLPLILRVWIGLPMWKMLTCS